MGKHPYLAWYTGDWLKDAEVTACAPSTRAIWFDLLCAMHVSGGSGSIAGTIEQLARVSRCTVQEFQLALADLIDTGAASVTHNANVTDSHQKVTVTNRRMLRESKEKEQNRLRQDRHRKKNSSNDPVTSPLHTSSSISTSNKEFPNGNSCSEPPKTATAEPMTEFEFATIGKSSQTWILPQAKYDSFRKAFQTIDLDTELRKAVSWCETNPTKRKTPRGMPAFLWRWIERAQNDNRGAFSNARPTGKPASSRVIHRYTENPQ